MSADTARRWHRPVLHRTPRIGPRADDWWRGAVIYQIYPRSFADGNGDGVGDLPGILARLDHVAGLGVDAIWISPFFTSPMRDYGYDVADYRGVDPLFGTSEDFERIVTRAHALGLKVMIDFVPSHSSDEHPWFAESRSARVNPKADWYVWGEAAPDGTPPNNWISVFGGAAWEWDTRRGQYYLHNFLKEQPDLNLNNPAVVEALLEDARFWFERGVDGLRLDAIDFGVHDPALRDNPPRPPGPEVPGAGGRTPFAMQVQLHNKNHPLLPELFLKRLRRLSEAYGATCLLGEISGDAALVRMAEYSDGGGLDMAYSFDLLTSPPTAEAIREIVEALEAEIAGGWACWSFANHDVPRSATRFGGEEPTPELAALLPALLASLRGTVCLYQGEELGLSQAELAFEELRDPVGRTFWPENKGRDGCRTPMPWRADAPHAGFSAAEPWLPVPLAHQGLAVDRQDADPDSVLNRCRAFFRWRKGQPALRRGDIRFVDAAPNVLAFERAHAGERLFCAFNLNAEVARIPAPANLVPLDCPTAHGRLEDGKVVLPAHAMLFGRLAATA